MNFWRYRIAVLIVGFIAIFFLLGIVSKLFAYNIIVRNSTDIDLTVVLPDMLGDWGNVESYIWSGGSLSGSAYSISNVTTVLLPASTISYIPISVISHPVSCQALYKHSDYEMTLSPIADASGSFLFYTASGVGSYSSLPGWASGIVCRTNSTPSYSLQDIGVCVYSDVTSINWSTGQCSSYGNYYRGEPKTVIPSNSVLDFGDNTLVKVVDIRLQACRSCDWNGPDCAKWIFTQNTWKRIFLCNVEDNFFIKTGNAKKIFFSAAKKKGRKFRNFMVIGKNLGGKEIRN